MKSLLLTLLLFPAIAMAADEAKPKKPGKGDRSKANPEAHFTKLDTNSDGNLSLDEFKAGPVGKKDPSRAEKVYTKIDKDSDGKLTLEEFKARGPKKERTKPGKSGKTKPEEPKPEEPKPATPKTEV